MEFEELLAYCRAEGRVCPMPQAWGRLWKMLPDRARVGHGRSPPLPLVLGAWRDTDDSQKRARLAEHLVWARDHQVLVGVAAMLMALTDSDWHYEDRP